MAVDIWYVTCFTISGLAHRRENTKRENLPLHSPLACEFGFLVDQCVFSFFLVTALDVGCNNFVPTVLSYLQFPNRRASLTHYAVHRGRTQIHGEGLVLYSFCGTDSCTRLIQSSVANKLHRMLRVNRSQLYDRILFSTTPVNNTCLQYIKTSYKGISSCAVVQMPECSSHHKSMFSWRRLRTLMAFFFLCIWFQSL